MTGRAFLDLQPGDCRWPMDEPDDPPIMFCGAPARAGTSYCHHHHKLACVPTKRRPPRKEIAPEARHTGRRERIEAG